MMVIPPLIYGVRFRIFAGAGTLVLFGLAMAAYAVAELVTIDRQIAARGPGVKAAGQRL